MTYIHISPWGSGAHLPRTPWLVRLYRRIRSWFNKNKEWKQTLAREDSFYRRALPPISEVKETEIE